MIIIIILTINSIISAMTIRSLVKLNYLAYYDSTLNSSIFHSISHIIIITIIIIITNMIITITTATDPIIILYPFLMELIM